MTENILLYNILIISILAIPSSLLGTISIWQRNAYFSDALSHGAIFGIAIAVILKLPVLITLIVFSMFFALIILYLRNNDIFSNDTSLAITSYSFLALGLFLVSILDKSEINLNAILTGKISDISYSELTTLTILAIITLIIVMKSWRKLLLITINRDLAKSININCKKYEVIFMLLLAIFVSFAIKIVGILMVAAIMVIPTASARLYAKHPSGMFLISYIITTICGIAGNLIAINFSSKTAPSVVICAAFIFIISILLHRKEMEK